MDSDKSNASMFGLANELPKLELFGKKVGEDVIVIAEIGVNHEGSIDSAMRMLELAAATGADAVKFQSYTPERFVAIDNAERFDRVSRFQLSEDAHRLLAERAREMNIHFCSSAISEDWVPLIAELGSAIKIASGDITFEPVIRRAASTGLPVILSSGASTLHEISTALNWISEECSTRGIGEQVVLLHCVSLYPTPIDQANVLSIPYLRNKLKVHVGWSNHVKEYEASLAAVALGAAVVEVHFTDTRKDKQFHDHHLSFEPEELRVLVAALNRVKSSLGRYGKGPADLEKNNLLAIRKGIVAARDLAAGTKLSHDDLMFARPATEFPAEQVRDLIGRTISTPVRRGALIRRDNVCGDSFQYSGGK